jgi:inosine-uridine nucleoside N-ribohydrolase
MNKKMKYHPGDTPVKPVERNTAEIIPRWNASDHPSAQGAKSTRNTETISNLQHYQNDRKPPLR